MNTCRLCLYKGDDKQVLSIWESQIEDLPNKIQDCVSINITKDDDLPTTACLSCIHQVMQWVIFKDTCDKSNKILVKTYASIEEDTSQYFSVENVKVFEYDNLQNRKLRKRRRESIIECLDEFESNDEENEASFFDDDFYDLDYKIELSDSIYKCDICIQEYDNCLDFLDHQTLHDGQPVFQCDKCTEVFSYRKDLVEHDRNHRRPCPQCGKMVLKSSMKLHLVKHTDKHMCSQCSGRFNSRASLAQHVITVHTDIKDHICETCGKRFSSQTAMRVHMKSHSDERLYQCKLCSYAGRTASALYVHMSTHANDLCVCEVCSKTFKSTRNLNDHLRRVHSKEKKHECNYCSKKFVDKYMLRVHVRCHTGVRPYQCKYCDKAFIRSDGLKEHVATHGQRIMYDCKECGKKFTSKRGLTRHACTSII